MKIKEQTRKLDADSSKHVLEVVDGTDVVSILHVRQGDIDVI
ncbi:chlorohydrolase [Streptococcus pneumoniae]|nr:chlorohydrolase [Streptococcus pneumoniae]